MWPTCSALREPSENVVAFTSGAAVDRSVRRRPSGRCPTSHRPTGHDASVTELGDLIERYGPSPDAQAVSWDREKWEKVWSDAPQLPGGAVLDRIEAEATGSGAGTIRRSWIRELADHDSVQFLAASTIWGFGGFEGRGRTWLQQMLQTPDVEAVTQSIIEASRRSPREGFSSLFRGGRTRIKYLGIAFGTKLVHFAGYDHAKPQPLILDKRVYASAVRLGLTDVIPNPETYTTGLEYETYCAWAAEVAAAHGTRGVEPQAVEYALFAAAGRW